MNYGFNSNEFQVSTQDGRNFTLLNQVVYTAQDGRVFVLPVGSTSDGASTPNEIWMTIPPFGSYWRAAFLHDCAYRNTLQDATGEPANLSKDESDLLLREAMQSCGTHEITAYEIYQGVHLAGWRAFREDRT